LVRRVNTILVTGGRGQVATALGALAPRFAALGFRLHKVGRPNFDFDRPDTIDTSFAEATPALVINTAAWTAVDLAESQPQAASRANDTGPARLGALCVAADIPLIHFSTDYVFDGAKGTPYLETDVANPLGVYGATKLAGENKIRALGGKTVILRSSGIYAAHGSNFVRTMLAAAQKTDTLRVVADQRLCPTSADDLAEAVLAVVTRVAAGWHESHGGIFHAAGRGETNWHDFAEAIFTAAARHGHSVPHITPISTAAWPTPARRPADSRLDCGKLEQIYNVRLPEWRQSVTRIVSEICRREAAVASPG
jgi:dTDP-4-dehydrorhamnose reductase